jgi:hypothetical protein
MSERKKIPAKNGGYFLAQQKGSPGLPGAGRPQNPFRRAIEAHAAGVFADMEVEGFLVVDGQVTDQKVKVQVSLPSVEAVVARMFRQAYKKGDVAAAKWLSETGFGKTINLSNDPDNPIGGGGFVLLLPDNSR